MYNIPYFKEKDPQIVIDFMKQHPFAMLIGCSNNIPVATQVPFLFDQVEDKLMLKGHIMRNTDHHKALLLNDNVLCVFTGAHTYVSASLYSNPQTGSTWNYITVHAKGRLRFLEEPALLEILRRTTAHFENNPDSPALFEHLPKDYVNSMAKAIVAIEIEVTAIDNVFKLSQNRDEESYERIIQKLEGQHDGKQIATEMELRKEQLFPGK